MMPRAFIPNLWMYPLRSKALRCAAAALVLAHPKASHSSLRVGGTGLCLMCSNIARCFAVRLGLRFGVLIETV
jgi:hypothetical protein